MKQQKTRLSGPSKFLLFVVIALIGFGLLIYFQRDTLVETWSTLLGANLLLVLMLPVLQMTNYVFIGAYYRKMFEQFGAHISVARSWGVVAAMNFVNQVLPSGGLSGITYLAYGFHAAISTGKTTLIQIGRYIFAFAAYAVLLPFAIMLLVQGGRFDVLSDVTNDALGNSGVLLTLVLFVVIMVAMLSSLVSRSVSRVIGHAVIQSLNWVSRNIFRSKRTFKLQFIRHVNDDFHDGIAIVRERGLKALRPGIYMFISTLVEVSIVYVSVRAVGGDVTLGPVFLAFVAANMVGVVSIVPGDVGVHEATVILVLVAFGVEEPVAISATLLYRVYNKVIFLPIGFYFYSRILRPAINANKAQSE